jgi:purine-binding chemotaxis protein CheW
MADISHDSGREGRRTPQSNQQAFLYDSQHIGGGKAVADRCLELVMFRTSSTLLALPLGSVRRVIPTADLARPPGLPEPLEGLLNLGGRWVPVLRLARILGLPDEKPGLYSAQLLLKGEDPIALLVNRVEGVIRVPEIEFLPISDDDSFNACAVAVVTRGGELIHVLSPDRILLAREQATLAAFLTTERVRLADWKLESQ